ncbi:ABC transporter substrate-binding protein [Haloarcula rubripromontorii]|uniref:ABC transporter substrate-binding protein n=1 Tax=Haloarcula rubripromontorii TaxID=1705562 RepID=A0A0M9AIA1_9EURY|nr:ABC transporter substrate-binding protein [Haloarcula rubripromontorii]KOX92627.1 ABC transporter substrate-binding protein [Haloarcula rubripromontorii]
MDETGDTGGFTRRHYLSGGGLLLGTSIIAGCSGNSAESASTATSSNTDTDGATPSDSGSYTASLSPVGEVEFDSIPENVFTMYNQYADMLVALDCDDAINSMFVPDMAGPSMNHYYERLSGVSFDWEDLPNPYDNFSKEFFYSLDSDIHFLDPAWAITQENWDLSDIEEVIDNIGPLFGNFYSGTHGDPQEPYSDDYRYYTLWEIFGRVATVFRERERYEQLRSVHEELIETIQTNLPPQEERPTAVRVTLGDGKFWTYHLNRPGFWLADTRPLAANDAFGDETWDGLWGSVGYETMLEADPDVILHLWGMTPRYDIDDIRRRLAAHSVGKELAAVKDNRVYAHGMRYQGPIMNLFQIEMTAKQLYPDVFGEWPTYENEDHYPEIPPDEQLFSRDRVAKIITGE